MKQVNNIKIIILINALIAAIISAFNANESVNVYVPILINSMCWIGIGIIQAIEEAKETKGN